MSVGDDFTQVHEDARTIQTKLLAPFLQLYPNFALSNIDGLGIFANSIIRFLLEAQERQEFAISQLSWSTAIGLALDRLGENAGYSRKDGSYTMLSITAQCGQAGHIWSTTKDGHIADLIQDDNGNLYAPLYDVVVNGPGTVNVIYKAQQMGGIKPNALNTVSLVANSDCVTSVANNSEPLVVGTSEETDSSLRNRRKTSNGINGRNFLQNLRAQINNISGVVDTKLIQNPTEQTDDKGVPPRSVVVVVDIGKEQFDDTDADFELKTQIVRAIANNVSANKTIGNISFNPYEVFQSLSSENRKQIMQTYFQVDEDIDMDYLFSLPTDKDFYLSFSVKDLSSDSAVPADIKTQIKNLVVAKLNTAQTLKIGGTITTSYLHDIITDAFTQMNVNYAAFNMFIGNASDSINQKILTSSIIINMLAQQKVVAEKFRLVAENITIDDYEEI